MVPLYESIESALWVGGIKIFMVVWIVFVSIGSQRGWRGSSSFWKRKNDLSLKNEGFIMTTVGSVLKDAVCFCVDVKKRSGEVRSCCGWFFQLS